MSISLAQKSERTFVESLENSLTLQSEESKSIISLLGILDVLTKCEADLPKEILEKVIEFEKAEKLNPPQERRSKQILTKDLQSDSEKIQREAEAKAIVFPPSLQTNLKRLPLYEDEQSDSTEST